MTDRSSKNAKNQSAGRARLGLALVSRPLATFAVCTLVVACASGGAAPRHAKTSSGGGRAYVVH
ncbi:MAG: hypothetical protein KC503_14940, partial [Myxococcales bacterium]|nr:hypothetical protein [Myxococcales bacterium]